MTGMGDAAWAGRGLVGKFRAPGAPASAATTSETAWHSGIAVAQLVSGRRYKIHARGSFTPSATSSSAGYAIRIRLGAGLGGQVLVLAQQAQAMTALTTVDVWSDDLVADELVAGSAFLPSGVQTFTISGQAATGTLTAGYFAGGLQFNWCLNVYDVGAATS